MKKPIDPLQPGVVRFAVEEAAYESSRSLDLLRIIDDQVRLNDMLSATFVRVAQNVREGATAVCKLAAEHSTAYLDADHSLQSLLECAGEHVLGLIERLREARASSHEDRDPGEDGGAVESLARAIEALADAHNAFEELKWAVMEHDADRAPRLAVGPHGDAEDLFAALTGDGRQ